MIHFQGRFITSAVSLKDAPPQDLAEVAFLGRSNVGKSSLINALLEQKNLAKSSSTPGKTRLINFFGVVCAGEMPKNFRFVDLPGFGYAKVSKAQKELWEKNLTAFLLKRTAIKIFLHLIDARHPGLETDQNVREFLQSICRLDQVIATIYTKTDKLTKVQAGQLLGAGAMKISSTSKTGINELRQYILDRLFKDGGQ
ncbi:MAG: ribosome biogenesis GTP-binding protein YihA/YsxC [Helicobacteraceae bacterium]